MGESRERDGFFGKYTEHFDDDGNKIGESREKEGFFGKYTEHTDAQGHKTGESRDREGFFGSYTEHTDTSGNKTGESRDREGFFGAYTEHVDTKGNKTGESRKREGFFGQYTEHTGSGWFSKAKNSNASDSPDDYGSRSGGYGSSYIGTYTPERNHAGVGTVIAGIVIIALIVVLGTTYMKSIYDVFTYQSEADKRYVTATNIESNQKSNAVLRILSTGTFKLVGKIKEVSEPEGSGGFWFFNVVSIEGNDKHNFMCSGYDEIYFRIKNKDASFSEGMRAMRNGVKVTLYFKDKDLDQFQRYSCGPEGCCCPIGIEIIAI